MDISLKKRKRTRRRRSVRRTYESQVRSPKLKVSSVKVRQAWRATRVRLLGAALLAALLALLGHLFFSYDFYVYEATIVGNHWLSYDAIYPASGVDTLNVFWISPRKAAAAIEALPGIREASVQASLPANVRIRVQEREPLLIWRTSAGDLWLDSEAVALPYGADPAGATFVVDSSGQAYQPNDRVNPTVVTSVQMLQAAFPDARIYYYQAHEGLSFQSPEGWPIQIGTSQDIARKVAVLQALRTKLQEQGIEPYYIDLRLVDHPVYAVADHSAASTGGN
jgi:cell division septal protein FtsQ